MLRSILDEPFRLFLDRDTVQAPSSQQDLITLAVVKWVSYSLIANIIIGLGVVSNILNLIILTRPSLKGITYVYLLALDVSNLMFLITVTPVMYDAAGNFNNQNFATAFYQVYTCISIVSRNCSSMIG